MRPERKEHGKREINGGHREVNGVFFYSFTKLDDMGLYGHLASHLASLKENLMERRKCWRAGGKKERSTSMLRVRGAFDPHIY